MYKLCCAACGHVFIETESIHKFNQFKDHELGKKCGKCGHKVSLINKFIEMTAGQDDARAKRVSMENLFDKQFITVTASREDKTGVMEIQNLHKLGIYYKQPKPFMDWVSIASQLAVGDYATLDLLGCDNVHVRNACKCPISVKTIATRQILRFTVMEHLGGKVGKRWKV